jgi:formate hydrogenlyase transcriptional activator
MSNQELIGCSPKFNAMLSQVSAVAPVDCSVLIQGETGTGKEVIARAIHESSPRRKNRFVGLNCSAIPGTLLESELFGHERGAYTGAHAQTIGRFQLADGGTLFLDEIGDLPLEVQPKLLRVLQEQQFERLGSSQTIQVNVRVIAATNQNLWNMVQERKFRADLYYRLNVFPISLPPLRERADDIPLLVRYFVQKYSERMGKAIDHVPDEVMHAIKFQLWPGNIRELQNFIERSVIMTKGSILCPPVSQGEALPPAESSRQVGTLAGAQRARIIEMLEETNWVVGGAAGAAARLGLPRTTLITKMRKLGISRDKARQMTMGRDGAETASFRATA